MQGKTDNLTDFIVCVSMHLECCLDKAMLEIATWAAVGMAHHSVTIWFQSHGSVNTIDGDSIHIRCTLGVCKFNSYSNEIKCEKALRVQYTQSTTIIISN